LGRILFEIRRELPPHNFWADSFCLHQPPQKESGRKLCGASYRYILGKTIICLHQPPQKESGGK
jgi:hypothetical protein